MSWATPAPITAGTPLSATQLDATASVPGTLVYSPPVGTVLVTGSHPLSVAFTPTDTTDFTNATGHVTLQVKALATTITLSSSANPSNFGQTITLTATVRSRGAVCGHGPTGTMTFKDLTKRVSYRPVTVGARGTAVFNMASEPLGAGVHSLTATYSGDDCFTASVSAPISQHVIAIQLLNRYFNPTIGFHEELTGAPPSGFKFEGTLGGLDSVAVPGTEPFYACARADHRGEFTSLSPTCEFDHVQGTLLGYIFTARPTSPPTVAIYRCFAGKTGDHFDTTTTNCEGAKAYVTEGRLGYLIDEGAHSLALLSTGAVKVWGDNSSGELGDGVLRTSSCGYCAAAPVAVIDLSGVVTAISAGAYVSLAKVL